MKKNILTINLLTLILLSGCASISDNMLKKQDEIINNKIDNTIQEVIPSNDFLAVCEDLNEFQNGDLKEFSEWSFDTSKKYYSCANKQKILSEYIQRNNKKEVKEQKKEEVKKNIIDKLIFWK